MYGSTIKQLRNKTMTDTNKTLFVSQLEVLAITMEESKPSTFDMGTYYKAKDDGCGYVACVCGEQAVSGRLEFFPIAESKTKLDGAGYINWLAGFIDEDLKEACIIDTGNKHLASSITIVNTDCRRENADRSELLTANQLKHPHLNTNSSPKQAASYIRMLISILTNDRL
jgi:hypothetical protein